MPDLKSELSKVINAWEKPAQQPEVTTMTHSAPHSAFKPTNNVCRVTFECIQKNPGKTRKEVVEALLESGFKKGSTTSIIGQMLKQGMVRETGGLIFAVAPAYVPIKSSKAFARAQETTQRKKVVVLKRRKPEDEAAPKEDTAQLPTGVRFTATVPELLATLNIVQARALYDELRKIFGG